MLGGRDAGVEEKACVQGGRAGQKLGWRGREGAWLKLRKQVIRLRETKSETRMTLAIPQAKS